jgi:hypothetical protein
MTTQYKTTKEVPTEALIHRLRKLSNAVSDNRIDEFTMRIPAECDRDADLVLQEAADRLERMQWQPIETVPPKTKVLVSEGNDYYAASLNNESSYPEDHCFEVFCGQPLCWTPKPEFWQPLPSPPQGDE